MREFLKKVFTLCKLLFESFIQIIIILIFFKFKNFKFAKIKNEQPKIIILGNGPSLIKDLKKLKKIDFDNSDFFCVNSFAELNEFEQIQPKYYIIVDPLYFLDTPRNKEVNFKRRNLISEIKEKTSWPLIIFIPRYYISSKFVELVSLNKNITFVPINNIPMFGGFTKFKHFIYDLNLGNPIFQNVLIASIFIAIKKCPQKIILLGADHSWLPNLSVLENNKVVLNDFHFSETKDNYSILTEEDGSQKKLHVFLKQLSIMFREYQDLNIYAMKKQIKIFNRTENSFIDAFEKNYTDDTI